jgi:hypothetical protein
MARTFTAEPKLQGQPLSSVGALACSRHLDTETPTRRELANAGSPVVQR